MADMPGSLLAASPGEEDDRTIASLGLGYCDLPVVIPRPGFLSKVGEAHASRLSF